MTIENNGVPIRLSITKQSAMGEQIQVDIPSWNPVTGEIVITTPDEVAKTVDQAFDIIDLRLQEMNMRTIEAHGLREFVTKNFGGSVWQKIDEVLQVIYGRVDIRTLLARWESIIEENEALKKGREEAAKVKVVG